MKVGGFFIGAEAVLLNTATLGCERYGLISSGTRGRLYPASESKCCNQPNKRGIREVARVSEWNKRSREANSSENRKRDPWGFLLHVPLPI
jgi:hypothetical protein